MFGISGQEFVFWVILAGILIGPSRLPGYLRTVREKVRQFKRVWELTSQGVNAEMQETLSDIGVEDFNPQKLLGLEEDLSDENSFTPVPPRVAPVERRREVVE